MQLCELDELIKYKEYDAISKLSFKVDFEELIKSDFYISWIMKANFEVKNYDLNCYFIENLIRNKKETYEEYLYLFTSLLLIDDLYRIKSYLYRSKLLNSEEINNIFDGDFTVFTNLKSIEDDNMFSLLILIIFLKDLFDNNDIDSLTKDEKMICFYETLDNAYSNGIEIQKLETIKYIGNLLFNNQIFNS